MTQIKKYARIGVIGFCLLGLTSCADMTPIQEKTLVGTAIGTTAGAVGTLATGGCLPCGAAVGGAVGAASGYVIEKVSD